MTHDDKSKEETFVPKKLFKYFINEKIGQNLMKCKKIYAWLEKILKNLSQLNEKFNQTQPISVRINKLHL